MSHIADLSAADLPFKSFSFPHADNIHVQIEGNGTNPNQNIPTCQREYINMIKTIRFEIYQDFI